MAKAGDDDLGYLDHYYDDAKLSEYDLLELGAREMFPQEHGLSRVHGLWEASKMGLAC